MPKGLPKSLSRGSLANRPIVRRRIDLTGVTVTVSATGSAIGFGSVVLDSLPEGNIAFMAAVATIGFAGSGSDDNLTDTWSGDFGIGTTPASDATITGTDVDIVASTAIGPATAEVIAPVRAATGTYVNVFDNTAGSMEVNLNVLIDAAAITDDESVELTLSGFVELAYIIMGDD